MDRINKLLRRLTPGQIIAAAVVTLVLVSTLIIFGLGPLVTTLLLPLGEPVSAVGGFIFYFGGGWLLGDRVGTVFGRAYYDRKSDDLRQKIYEEFEANKANG